jgi:hypothetical protein
VKRPYVLLAAGILVLGVALSMLGRPRHAEAPRTAGAESPVVDLAIVIEAGKISPAATSVSKGDRVRLRVECRGAMIARLALAGYEDRLDIPSLEPGRTWTTEFLADRPGEDFAWLLDGQPAGRFMVTGSHLIEGHR